MFLRYSRVPAAPAAQEGVHVSLRQREPFGNLISLREVDDQHDKKADEQKNKEAETAVGERVLPKRAADLYVAGHRMTPEQLLQKQRHRHQQSEKCEASQPSHEINPTVLTHRRESWQRA